MAGYDQIENFAIATLTAGISAVDVSMTVDNGALYPTPGNGFNVVVWPAGQMPLLTNSEIMRVTARATNVLTISRAQEGTTAKAFPIGTQVAMARTKKADTDQQGAWANLRTAKTANYTVVNADKGSTFSLGGAAYFTMTVGAASGFDANYAVRITNTDTVRGKKVSANGMTDFILYAGQTIVLYNDNNVWRTDSPNGTGAPRWRLPGNATLFVDGTNGNDANDGMAAGTGNAFATIARATSVIQQYVDLNFLTCTVQVASGTYTAQISVSTPFTGSGFVSYLGDTTTPANVTISTTSADAVALSGSGVRVSIGGFKFQTTTSGHGIHVTSGALCFITGKCEFGACVNGHITAGMGGNIQSYSIAFTVSGGASAHLMAESYGGIIVMGGCTRTLSGTPAFSLATAYCASGYIQDSGGTFGGTGATGQRYNVSSNGIIQTFGGGATYFPGSIAGAAATGGIYA